MAFRRDVVTEMGGFDASFGPGGRFPSADDFDLELRLLLKGWHVYEHAGAIVIHHGFRTMAEGRAHTVRDWRALGASCGKVVRSGHLVALVMATSILWRRAFWPALKAVVRRHRPALRRVVAFTVGFFAGLAIRVDRENLLHVLPQTPPSTA
jgi:GT2 family glycosyltransferase